jgi:hypothetical protein
MTRIRFDGCDLSPGRGTPVPEGYSAQAAHRSRLWADWHQIVTIAFGPLDYRESGW